MKARPRVRLRAPSEVRVGETFEAVVHIECKRAVEVEYVEIELVGSERWRVVQLSAGPTQYRPEMLSAEATFLHVVRRPVGAGTLPEGETVLALRYEVPPALPPSYDSPAARIEYRLRAHVSVPWLPDRRREFVVAVLPREVPSPEGDHARRYSSRAGGAPEGEPHLELSLASDWSRAGEHVYGALALSNLGGRRYTEAIVTLIALESLGDGLDAHAQHERARYAHHVGLEGVQEGEAVPFRFRVPSDAYADLVPAPRPGGKGGLIRSYYALEVVARVRFGDDLRLRVPFTVLPPSTRAGDAPPRFAPPSVGSDRLREDWTAIGAPHGLVFTQDTFTGSFGATELTVRREHRGRDGVYFVAEVRYPELHLGLEAVPATKLHRLRPDKRMGDAAWDSAHHLDARDEAQCAAVLSRLVPSLGGVVLRRMDDHALLVEFRDARQTRAHLAPFVAGATRLARTMEALRSDLPPPPRLAAALPEWRALAARLGTPLETARMRVSGPLAGHEVEARVSFDRAGQPLATWLSVRAPTALDAARTLTWRRGEDATPLEARLGGEALAHARALLAGASALSIEAERVTLGLDALLGLGDALSAVRAEQMLLHMVRLVELLRGEKGPYR